MADDVADVGSAGELEYTGLDQASAAQLRGCQPAVVAALPGILDRFYERTTRHPELGKLFPDAAKGRGRREDADRPENPRRASRVPAGALV